HPSNRPTAPVKRTIPPPNRPPPDRTGLPPDNPLAGIMTTREEEGIDDVADLVPPGQVIGDPNRNTAGGGGDGVPDAATAPGDAVDPFCEMYGCDEEGFPLGNPGGPMIGA